MGLIVFVYRAARDADCTNGGISSKANKLCLVNVEGPFSPDEDMPAALLQNHHGDCLRIVAAAPGGSEGEWMTLRVPGATGPMSGGNLASTSDSRFADACEKLIGRRFYGGVYIHDRYER